MNFLLGRPIFRGYVKLQVGNISFSQGTFWVDDFPLPHFGYVIVPWRVKPIPTRAKNETWSPSCLKCLGWICYENCHLRSKTWSFFEVILLMGSEILKKTIWNVYIKDLGKSWDKRPFPQLVFHAGFLVAINSWVSIWGNVSKWLANGSSWRTSSHFPQEWLKTAPRRPQGGIRSDSII